MRRLADPSIVGFTMRGYGQFCPVALACEILAERWTPLIVRELLCGSHRFSDLRRGVPLISRSLLAQRLKGLEDAGVLQSTPRLRGQGREYHLTPAGEELGQLVQQLGEWGQRWTRGKVDPQNLDGALLMWDIHRRLNVDRMPARRVVVQFDLRGGPRGSRGRGTYWLVVAPPEVDVCLKDPGFDVDLCVKADIAALTQVWLGDLRLGDAIRSEAMALEGSRELIRAFPSWFGLSSFAGVPRPVSPPRIAASR